MSPPTHESEAVAERLEQAADRLRAQPSPAPPSDAQAPRPFTTADAVVRLREACDDLAATELEVRRARSEIARLAARAAARRPPLDAA